ncbi:receptor-like protein 47 [Actinidia eriantha]|uniref:receptor-like protein 47 n=1 Tax=Actinidia eriantha TaxID=165200 RepID=UPI0025896A42|nr:receptor-like protein 47 [Actinidia eriantha]
MAAEQVGDRSSGDSSRAYPSIREEETIVGFEEEVFIIKEQLTGVRKQLDVISIVGMPGLEISRTTGPKRDSSTINWEIEEVVTLNPGWLQFLMTLIPESIGALQNLVLLSLNNINFSGPIPHPIGNLSKLYRLDLNENKLSGILPVSSGNLHNFTISESWLVAVSLVQFQGLCRT